MKKIILSLFICVLASETYAQKFRFGLTATPLMIDWLKSNTDSLTSGGIKLGFTYMLCTVVENSSKPFLMDLVVL